MTKIKKNMKTFLRLWVNGLRRLSQYNQSTNHIEADSREGKKLPKYYLFLVEPLCLHLVIYL